NRLTKEADIQRLATADAFRKHSDRMRSNRPHSGPLPHQVIQFRLLISMEWISNIRIKMSRRERLSNQLVESGPGALVDMHMNEQRMIGLFEHDASSNGQVAFRLTTATFSLHRVSFAAVLDRCAAIDQSLYFIIVPDDL